MQKSIKYPVGECEACLPCCNHCQYFVAWEYLNPNTDEFVMIDPIVDTLDTPGDGWCVVHRKSVMSSLGCNSFLCSTLPRVSQAAASLDNPEAMHQIAEQARAKYPLRIAQN